MAVLFVDLPLQMMIFDSELLVYRRVFLIYLEQVSYFTKLK